MDGTSSMMEDEQPEGDMSDPDASEDVTQDAEDDASSNNAAENNAALPDLPDQPWSVEAKGPYEVGYRTQRVDYTTASGDERRMRLAIWYPSRQTLDRDANYYGLARPGVYTNVEPGLTEPAPIMIFSHGSGGFAEQSFTMTEFFASHGWIVVAPDHTGNTFLEIRQGIPPEILDLRPQDILAVLDHLDAFPEDDPLTPFLSEDILLSGHSFGGYTTLSVAGAAFDVEGFFEFCGSSAGLNAFCDYLEQDMVTERFVQGFGDSRIKAAIPMAPFGGAPFNDGVSNIDIPVLLMTALGDRTLPPAQDGDPIWDGLDGEDDLRLDFITGGHFTFSDACTFSTTLGVAVGAGDGCGSQFVSPEEGYFLINAYAMAFARYHMFGDDTDLDILTGERVLNNTHVRLYQK